jgi:phosphosulfolactate synthase (CoM biosynthesis protein A)
METQELQLSTSEKLSLFETTKEQRTSFVNDIIESLNAGTADPLLIHLQVKAMENIIDQLTNTDEKKNKNFIAAIRYKKMLLEAAEKYSAKTFEFKNAKFSIGETGTKYDYSNCNDSVYALLKDSLETITEKIKEREEFLKKLPSAGFEAFDKSTGEVVTLYPPSKKSTTSVSVSFK